MPHNTRVSVWWLKHAHPRAMRGCVHFHKWHHATDPVASCIRHIFEIHPFCCTYLKFVVSKGCTVFSGMHLSVSTNPGACLLPTTGNPHSTGRASFCGPLGPSGELLGERWLLDTCTANFKVASHFGPVGFPGASAVYPTTSNT